MRKKIGIITGSGPEAGIDLWQKILQVNKQMLQDTYSGDLDAPNVTIMSVPELGYSMEIEKNYTMVWHTLENAIREICKHVDYFVIACNTLNVYSKKIEQIYLKHKFISTYDVVKEYIEDNSLEKACIIGAKPVVQMEEYSVFSPLKNHCEIEVPKDMNGVHQLIYDVKKFGADSFKIIDDFRHIVDTVESRNVFLACTELPLINLKFRDKNLIDVTHLLAKKVVEKTF